jgi:outer membrane receptor protein involved in Fe transport
VYFVQFGLSCHFRQLTLASILVIGTASIASAQTDGSLASGSVESVTVAAERTGLLGSALTSSQGEVAPEELDLTPAYRPGQLLETVPGLVATAHSGEGKANQYLLRGVNLDHGTDLATFVDGMPINEPTHAHGQGYTDLNFLIPELAGGIDFTKGPYFAAIGDFGSVGSVRIALPNEFPTIAKGMGGTLGFGRLLVSGPLSATGSGMLDGALELQHYDGPWTTPDNQRKFNAVLRYGTGDQTRGWSLTAMGYGSLWNATTDQPIRAINSGMIGRFGSLDPSDGGLADRYSLSGQYHNSLAAGDVTASAYVISNRLTLWNNFTHFLVDPINGDQESQNEARVTTGGGIGDLLSTSLFGLDNDLLAGLQFRYDNNHVSRDHTRARIILSVTENDIVNIGSAAAYLQDTIRWTEWFRSVLGLREDFQAGSDRGSNPGNRAEAIFEPKGSMIFGPWRQTELYISGGDGYHSDDLRGVNQARIVGLAGAPLLARQYGEEIGLRSNILPNVTATFTAFRLDSQSETTYDPDVGADAAGPGSKRVGVEFNATYQTTDWLEFYVSLAASHARYTSVYDDGTNHTGYSIPNAPALIGSFNAYINHLGPWSGGLGYRYLGQYPLTPDNQKRAPGYGEWDADVTYAFTDNWNIGLGLYNLLNTKANAAEFWYVDRLPNEPAAGVADIHVHPLEPLMARLTVTKSL